MSLQSLDFDVLETIMSYVQSRDALPLTTMCRALHEPATRRLLSDISIHPNRQRDHYHGMLFCDHMLANSAHRARYMRTLTLWPAGMNPVVLNHLAEVIRHATNLRAFHLDTTDDAFYFCPPLADAFADASSLTTIEFNFVSPEWMQPTSRLILDGADTVLSNLVGCLTMVTLNPNILDVLVDVEPRTVCPHARELVVGQGRFKSDHWELISRVFPSTRIFRTQASPFGIGEAHTEWTTLDLVQTTNPILLRCYVTRLELDVNLDDVLVPEESTYKPADYFETLRCVSPVALTCFVDLNRQIVEWVTGHLIHLRVLHLMTCDLRWWHLRTDVAAWTDDTLRHLASTVASSKLRAVIIELPHNFPATRALLRSHAENIVARAGTVELVGIRCHAAMDRGISRIDKYTMTRYNWYRVERRENDGSSQLNTLAQDDVLRIVPGLLQSFEVAP
ncbi:uncharacterized protein B0H18DRAFT_1212511 [Fomitopsis serialis]|uniref:uncharacterized protein n=1 Tax=Fomitopsis serialis TaxID=139415 RepID=UPI0020072084|nr:uncharacterized protein B0H18DRAFT_1212511 [Neoantrodia serialis]KAH9922641.1 hypothetical protein B0H18DRAFT_1212511 [Neoantrodia serialis]